MSEVRIITKGRVHRGYMEQGVLYSAEQDNIDEAEREVSDDLSIEITCERCKTEPQSEDWAKASE